MTTQTRSFTSNFEDLLAPGQQWAEASLSPSYGWRTFNAGNRIEIGKENVYGLGSTSNTVIELESNPNAPSDLYTYIQAARGSTVTVDFDFAGRRFVSTSGFKVFWEGNEVGHFNGISGTWNHRHMELTATGTNSKLQFVATTQDGQGALLDNINVSYTEVTEHRELSLNFEGTLAPGQHWSNQVLPTLQWHTNNPGAIVEIAKDHLYGELYAINDADRFNTVLELESNPGDASNLYTQFLVAAGTKVTFDFDLSGRAGVGGSDSAVKVMWQGQQVDVITPHSFFGWQHYHYELDVGGRHGNYLQKLELVAVNNNGVGALVDNLRVGYEYVIGA